MDKTKEKIQELVPKVIDGHECHCLACLSVPITLAVVLRAMSRYGVVTQGANALINIVDISNPNIRWDLEHDNYDAQSQETKDFIGSLLN